MRNFSYEVDFFSSPPKLFRTAQKLTFRAFGRRSRLYYLKLEKFCWGILDTHIGPQFNGHFVFSNFLHLGGSGLVSNFAPACRALIIHFSTIVHEYKYVLNIQGYLLVPYFSTFHPSWVMWWSISCPGCPDFIIHIYSLGFVQITSIWCRQYRSMQNKTSGPSIGGPCPHFWKPCFRKSI